MKGECVECCVMCNVFMGTGGMKGYLTVNIYKEQEVPSLEVPGRSTS